MELKKWQCFIVGLGIGLFSVMIIPAKKQNTKVVEIKYEPIEDLIFQFKHTELSISHSSSYDNKWLWLVTIFPGQYQADESFRKAFDKAKQSAENRIAELCGSK